VKDGHGPATVNGNESQKSHWPERDGKARRVGSKAVSQDTRLKSKIPSRERRVFYCLIPAKG